MAASREEQFSSTTFDLVQVGTSGLLDAVPAASVDDVPSFPLITLPAGLPPVLPSLKSEVELLLTDLEGLSIHDFKRCQRSVAREPQYDRLLHVDVCPVQTQIKVDRHSRTGEVLGYSEELVPDTAETSRNSLSLRRAPDTTSAGMQRDLRGSNINLPFWPGGLDDDLDFDSLDNLTGADGGADIDFADEKSFLTAPPGFANGMTFKDESPKEESGSAFSTGGREGDEGKDVAASAASTQIITLADILAAEDVLSFEDSDEEKEENKDEDEQALDQVDVKQELQEGDGLDLLVQASASQEPKPASDSQPKKSKKEQWSVQVDVNSPVKDFYKRIPDMAYKWPFELDIFQKQAILRLENHESVFVAAHTSAGKTVVAEYAIALSLKHMTRTIYTSPIKALSNQKFRDFKMTFKDVGLVTGDVQLNQTAGCLIMTTEILRSMLYNGSDVIRDLEWVIFDEVHYINDSERGVVWEEVLIMLPHHVNVILLSATVPNSMEFADWVGRTKRKQMYVVSTLKRPVPLEHFLYTGNSTKTCNELFLLLDAKGSFLTSGYNKALEAKKERASKSSQSFGAKGTRPGNPSQDRNVWLSVIEMLKRKDKLPAVSFIFSKKKIEETSASLHNIDLTTSAEKSQIHVFFHKCISKLKGTDKKLPQVLQLEDLLKRGLGVHHSGVLPILKEVVEMLFQKGLLKILFATETFAMGVNMPARTVIFDHTRKHDGLNFRNLLPGEYIQMAGRAGRRGLDSTGTVILLCKGDVPEMSELHKMMLGKPTSLESQFRLTYTMILNLMRVEQLRVQDMMRRSFSEFHHQKETTAHKESLEELKKQMATIATIECYLCSLDLEKYFEDCQEFHKLQNYLQSVTFSHPAAVKSLSAGRVVMIKRPRNQSVLGAVLSCSSSGQGGDRTLQVLVVADKTESGEGGHQFSQQSKGFEPVLPPILFLPDGPSWHQMCQVKCEDISRITTKTIKVDADGIINDCRKREMHRFKDDPPDRCVTMATQELVRLSEANPSGLAGLHLVNDLKARDIELVELCRRFQFLEEGFGHFNCTRCPQFEEHFKEYSANMHLKAEYKRLQYLLSDDSLALLPEYTQRVQVLKELHYVDASGTVQLKGRVACEISNHELMITELVFENILTDLHPTEIAAILSCFVFEMKRCTEPNLTDTLTKSKNQVLERAEMIGHLQKSVGMTMPVDDFKEQFHFGLLEVVFEWARGMPFAKITELTDVHEGIIVRTIQRLHETLSDVRNAARLIGDRTLALKMETAMDMIKRDIVFAASLYTQ